MFFKGGYIQENDDRHPGGWIVNLGLQVATPGSRFPMNVPEAILGLVIADALGLNRVGEKASSDLNFAEHLFGREL